MLRSEFLWCPPPEFQRPGYFPHEVARLDAERSCHLHHLDQVKATLTALVLGDEGLGTVEEPGKLSLGELPRAPRGDEGLAQPRVGRTEKRSSHRSRHTTAGNLDPDLGYPKLGYDATDLTPLRRAAVARRRRSWRRDALRVWGLWLVLGAYFVVEGYANRTADARWGIGMLAIGGLPAIGGLAGYWYVKRRLNRRKLRRPTGPIAASREPIPAGLRFAVLRRDGFRCAYCGRGEPEGVQLHIDHIVPVARGGRTELENLVTACATCNVGKSASDLVGSP